MLHLIISEMQMQFFSLPITTMHLREQTGNFLFNLGRVKDAFELDKMFFIVNAIDLATDEEEADCGEIICRKGTSKVRYSKSKSSWNF